MSTDTPRTKAEAYKRVKAAGDDVSLRVTIAASIADEPATTSELSDRFPNHSANAIRPRVDELLRMGCVKRSGTRTNPSGHDAYLHHLTERGDAYLRGDVDPEPGPTVSELKTEVVDVARAVVNGDAPPEALDAPIRTHDTTKLTRDPEWTPPYSMTDDSDTDTDTETDTSTAETDTDADAEADTDTDTDTELTEQERERIKADPVLELSDFREEP
jgi:hypothetical protein